MKGIFVIKGDSLTVYKSYKDWFNVMYIAKDGEDYTGWVSSKQIKINGQYGNNP
jgi:riboflavin synthase alpha subunit